MNQTRQFPILRDPAIMSGTPVFAGTRVPVQALFSYLEHGTVDEFVDEFPTVTRQQALEVLMLAGNTMLETVA
jgi:uncharacterized protein (DUF433 family)